MKHKTEIIIAIIAVCLIGFVFLIGWQALRPVEKCIEIPITFMVAVPEARLVSEKIVECSYHADYVYDIVKEDRSDDIANAIKIVFLQHNWKLIGENAKILEFSTDRADATETLSIRVSYEQGKGTFISLDYNLQPCTQAFSGHGVTWKTSTDEERGIGVLAVPGMRFISEEKGECSYHADYVYDIVKDIDISGKTAEVLKNIFLQKDWKLKDARVEDGINILDFYTEKAVDPETMTIKISFENGTGTFISLDYRWQVCAQD